MDAFSTSFLKYYQSNPEFKQSLIVNLLQANVAKAEGIQNPQFSAKVMNFFLAMTAQVNKKTFDFVSANLCQVLLKHIQQIPAAKKSAPFINLSKDEMSVRIVQHIQKIRSMLGDDYKCVAFTVGVDTTVLVEAIQLHEGVIIGGVSRNHFVRVADHGIDEVRELLGRYAKWREWFCPCKRNKDCGCLVSKYAYRDVSILYSFVSSTDCEQKQQFWKTSS